MRVILNKHIEKAKNMASEEGEGSEGALEELKIALKILLMKPDRNIPKAPLLLQLQNQILQYESFMKILQDLTQEAIEDFKSKKGSIAYQASLLYVLENTIAYLQAIENEESQLILTTIKEAKLKASKEIENYFLMEMERGKTASPSYLANRALQARQLKKAKKLKSKKKKAGEKKERSLSSVARKQLKTEKKQKEKTNLPTDKEKVIPIEL